MHKKTKSPLDGVVSDYTLRMLFIFFTLFTLHASLLARDALPPLVEKGEVFDPKTYKENFYIAKQSSVISVAISSDGKTIVSGSYDNNVKIWDRASGKLLKTLKGHTSRVNSVAISSDGKTIVSGSGDGSVKIWDRASGKLLKTLKGYTSSVNSVAISEDGKTIVSGSYDSSVKIWDRASGKLLKTLKGHTSSVNSVAISSDGKTIVSGSYDSSVKIWDRASGKLLKTLKGYTSSVNSVAISEDGKTIVSGSYDSSVKIWDRASGKLLKSLEGHTYLVSSVVISRDGKTIVSGSGDGSVKIWDRARGKLLKSLEGHTGFVSSIAISNDGKTIVSGSWDKSVKIWDIKNRTIIKTIFPSNKENIVNSVDNKTITISKDEKSLKVWDTKKNKLINILSIEDLTDEYYSEILISEDFLYALIPSSIVDYYDLWDIATQKKIISFNGHEYAGENIDYKKNDIFKNWIRKKEICKDYKSNISGDNSIAIENETFRYVISGEWDKEVKLWDRKDGKILKIFKRYTPQKSKQKIGEKDFFYSENSNWLIVDNKKKRFYRRDDGTMLLQKKGNTISSVFPSDYNLSTEDKLLLSVNQTKLKILSGQSQELKLKFINQGEQNSYFLGVQGEGKHLVIESQRVLVIKKGESQEITLKVWARLDRSNPKPLVEDLNISVISGNGSKFNLLMPVKITYADINVTKAEVSEDGKNLNIVIQNSGNEDLKNAKIKLLKPFDADTRDLALLEVNATKPLSYALPLNENIDKNDTVELTVFVPNIELEKENPKAEVAPSTVWHIENVTIALNALAWYVYVLWAVGILVSLGLIWYYKRYKNPLIVKLTEDPNSLKRLNAEQLKEAEERLSTINRLESTLALANVSKKEFENALAFYAGTKEERAEIFSQKIKRSTLNKDAEFFKLNCTKSDLSVDDFSLYFTTQRAEEVEEQLRERGDRVFVISSGEEQEKMVELGHEKTNNIIACSEQELSEFLLSSKAENVFMKILSECLEFSSISLYQTSGGLQKENDFFGRIKIVRDIKMNSKYNYMIVGGRQLGKSSILRKLHRSYATSSTVDCRFINLEGKKGELIRALAENFALSERAGLEDVLAYVRQSKKKMLLLIDEVDEFVEPEQANDYETLKALKNLAEEGKANFVLAGYWTLYQYITADYQSPLYNFGELIVLEGLEKKACRELMREPMKRIGVSYEDEASLDEVIELCGQRANLIATVCDEVLKIQETKNISAKALKNALQSQAVDAKLEGWDNIDSYNDRNSRIDRMVILVSVEKEQFELDEVLSLFEELGAKVDASEIKKSLERLVIAYVLQKEGAVFSFRVPLMKAHILKTNEKGRKALLEEEVAKLSSNN